jgi:hypothetical protein
MISETLSVAKADFVRFSVGELGSGQQLTDVASPSQEAAATPAAGHSEHDCSYKVRFCCNEKGMFWLASSSADGMLLVQDVENRAKTTRAAGYRIDLE